jgi:hypothetical protein
MRALLIVVALLALVGVARSAQTFNVAIGMVTANAEVSDPNFFQILQTSGLKPADWTLTNPHSNVPGNAWCANLNTLLLSELLEYDLVQITNHQATPFTDAERDNIRTWVHAGGQIWIDDCGNMEPSNFFAPFDFVSYDPHPVTGAKGTDRPDHAIFHEVYDLTQGEIAALGNDGYSSHIVGYDPAVWTELMWNRGNDGVKRPDLLVMEYGLGRVIVSADDYGCGVNDSNNPEDIKLSYNILAYTRTPVIPEPSALLLLGAGAVAVAPLARRRRA